MDKLTLGAAIRRAKRMIDDAAAAGGGIVDVSGSTPVITAEEGNLYVCGTVATLSFTPSATGLCGVLFVSGSTAAVLTVPSTVQWPDGFNPASLEAGKAYELSVLNGKYGVVTTWQE